MHKHATANRFYRLVWSHVHACWVAVAEGARGRGKSASRKLSAALIGGVLSGAALAAGPGLTGVAAPLTALPATNALPTGPQVVAGQASVNASANQMTVRQGSDKAILNWQSFDIGSNAAVRFVQPSANAVALNRVLGPDPSRIYGQLSSNGKVFLVNQNGVLFGASARVDVGGLVASSLALPDGEFLAGRYTFAGTAGAGAVRNEGVIRAADGGYVALLGPTVSNSGSVVAPHGGVALGAGEQVGIDLHGDGLITLRIARGAAQALVENSGLIAADGGRVTLSAQGSDALARATVNNTGLVQARGLVADGGSIRLAGDGDVRAGALDVSSQGGQGGAVAVEGRFVALDGAIDAGGVQGGSVAVDAGSTLSTAARTTVAGLAEGGSVRYTSAGTVVESSSASVDASGTRQGGSIAVHGDGGVLSSASYDASAGAGAGGRIDVSGSTVRLLGAQLDASGATQGGLVRIGGAFQGGAVRADAPDLARFVTRWGGSAPIANATETFVGDNTAIRVGASGAAGQGGTAVVWSDKRTTMLGSVDARGAGAAGSVEISSKDELRHVGLERIALGAGGQLLLDPKNITIGTSSGAWTYQAILGKGVYGPQNLDVALNQGDGFGFGVALNVAGDRLAVGTPYSDGANGGGVDRGAVHLFSFTDTTFNGAALQGTIGSGYTGGKNLNIALGDGAQFGSAVALNADATRLAVGATGDGSGAVRLIRFNDTQFGTPTLTQTIGAAYGTPGLQSAAYFGAAVALNASGDRLAVGAIGDAGLDGDCGNCGAVYLFNNALGSPAIAKTIGAGHGLNLALPADAQFGTSVALDGSGDKLAVGAYGVDDARGAVYLFNNAYGATAHVATLGNGYSGGKNLNLPLADNEAFGSGVALNSSGTRLAVGATGSGGGDGSIRIIDFADSQFSAPAVKATVGSGNTEWAAADNVLDAGENFGFSLALNGNGDRLVVGSPFSDGEANDNGGYGAVRAFALLPIVPSMLAYTTLPNVDVTLDAVMLRDALDSGTSITLQANNDIVLEAGHAINVADGSGNGALRLQAGRSVTLNSSITTGNANLTVVANDTAANGVDGTYRDAGKASIALAAGTTLDAGSGQVSLNIADGAGKANRGSGAISVNGGIAARTVSLKNQGPDAGSDIVIGAAGSINGTGNGTIEVAVAGSGGGTFTNNAGAAGLNPGAGRYLVYSNNPGATLEGTSGYAKHYNQAYTGTAPGYAASGNWFLYSVAPVVTVNATPTGKVYDGTLGLPLLDYTASGLIDGDTKAVFSGALAVSGLTKHVGTYAIDAGTLGNALGYTVNYTGASFSVTPRQLNVSMSGVDKTYDGNTATSVVFGDNRVAGDLLTVSGNATFANKHAGSGKLVNVDGIAISGNDAANYQLAATSGSTSADIATRVLHASATGLGKTYDGGVAATVVLGDDRVAGDQLGLSGSASFADKGAGTNKTVTVSGIALDGADAANYTLAAGTIGTSADIARRTLTVSAAGIDKVYDGNVGAHVVLGDNRVGGDLLDLSGSASFADKTAGTGKVISVSGIAVGGADAANYTLASTSATTSASIAKRSLTVGATGIGKTYDGNTSASVSFSDDRVQGDLLDLSGNAAYTNKGAGSARTILVSGIGVAGQDAANYILSSDGAATQADIARRTLSASATGIDKIYDGTLGASVNFNDDRLAGDQLSLAGSASFADKHAANNKAVTVSGITLDGADALNYTLAAGTLGTSADITRRTLTVAAMGVDKTYDGNAAANVVFSDDRVGADLLDLSGSASFADKNVGAGKSVSVSAIAVGGADAANYTLASTSATTSASIAKRSLTVSAAGVGKTYDGNTSASVSFSDDRVSGDLLAVSGSAAFADRNAGTGKTVTASGLALTGADAGNYSLASSTALASATIAPRLLLVSASGVDKVYDGGIAADVVLADDRLEDDVFALSAFGRFADRSAGTNKVVTVDSLVMSGTDAGNYAPAASSLATTATIRPKVLGARTADAFKTYDGTDSVRLAAGQVALDGFVAGEGASVGAIDARFDSANVLQARGVSAQLSPASVSAADGTLLSNYVLPTQVDGNGVILARTLTVRGMRVAAKGYDGSTAASVTDPGSLDGLVAGENLRLGGPVSAAFATPGAGSGKRVSASGYLLADGANGLASNYLLDGTATSVDGVIERATLTVRANDAARVAGSENPVFGYSVNGLVAGDSAAILPAFRTGSSANAVSAPGSYAITVASDATLDNYRFAFVDGVLNVTPAPVVPTPTPLPAVSPPGRLEPVVAALTHTLQRAEPCAKAAPCALADSDPVRLPAPQPRASVLTLSGGIEVLTVDGGVRTSE